MEPKYCPYCHSDLPVGAVFCPTCGQRLPVSDQLDKVIAGEVSLGSQPGQCPRCGHLHTPPLPSHCQACGYLLAMPSPPTSYSVSPATGVPLSWILEAQQIRIHHYLFSHRFLPSLFYSNPVRFLALLKVGGNEFLQSAWERVGLYLKDIDRLPADDLNFEIKNLKTLQQWQLSYLLNLWRLLKHILFHLFIVPHLLIMKRYAVSLHLNSVLPPIV